MIWRMMRLKMDGMIPDIRSPEVSLRVCVLRCGKTRAVAAAS